VPRQTAAIVLAAGASSRLGRPKQLVVLAGRTLLERILQTARDADCAPVIVVLGVAAERILEQINLEGAVVAVNESSEEGMAGSIRLGVRTVLTAAPESDGVLVMACDQPAVTTEHLRALAGSGQVCASSYAERRGIPVYFPSTAFAQLSALQGDEGARALLQNACSIPLPNGELDIDTESDLARAVKLFA
jgi:molybdenum cofactor cytidylyltransferase